ncbi:hypothetical protein EYF80_045181 [Liparis tanakae]|uniref:Uncharacterized protein n=1 Tax=Liparis tanakae TaxID=230148 RepID=A0A4Z2FUB4_9TELE|nr:hypothetical protein EYF80_045181 [Liparis tanakae]
MIEARRAGDGKAARSERFEDEREEERDGNAEIRAPLTHSRQRQKYTRAKGKAAPKKCFRLAYLEEGDGLGSGSDRPLESKWNKRRSQTGHICSQRRSSVERPRRVTR